MSEQNGKLYTAFSGLPTSPEVKRLVERYGVPTPGLMIPYDELVDLLGLSWKEARFDTILEVWRRKLWRENELISIRDPGVGVRFLTDKEKIGHSTGELLSGARKTRRGLVHARTIATEKLEDPKDRARADHLKKIGAQMFDAMASGAKALQPPAPPKQLPRVLTVP